MSAGQTGSPGPAGLGNGSGAATAALDQSLYEVRKRIYPRAVSGVFARWRIALVLATQLFFYGMPWLSWNGRQAVLFDLGARKFYILGLVFWPQDIVYLTVLLILSAYSLFLFTSVAGRLWCGYACPQTVYTEIFLWIERKVQGDRAARMRLDAGPWDARRLRLVATKHALWIALALWTGFTFVGYFTPIHELLAEVASAHTSGWETFWVLFYGFATYGNAGWMREQVCKYMCPYARFQSVMFDPDTLVITYDRARGEPRGSRGRGVDPASRGLGSCVDCGICVQVCPTGIDIRNGLQYECIGCAACIDGCDQVMDKMGYPRGLIRYTTENALARGYAPREMFRRVLRPRVLLYTGILVLVTVVAGLTLFGRVPVKVDVIRDRGNVGHETTVGDIPMVENVYRLQLMNAEEIERDLRVTVSGVPGLHLESGPQPFHLSAASARLVAVRVAAPRAGLHPGSNRIEFVIESVDAPGSGLVPVHIVERAALIVR